jgi:uncharacterized protein (TIGR00255 family)
MSSLQTANPVSSMTGYARVRRAGAGGEITVSVKSVNHRGLDIHIHTSLDLSVENEVRTAIKRRLTRGHVELRVGLVKGQSAQDGGLSLNRPMFEAYLNAVHEAGRMASTEVTVDVNAAMRVSGMISASADRDLAPEDEKLILSALDEALDVLAEFRQREGGELVSAMNAHNANIRRRGSQIGDLRKQATELYRARLEERLAELLRGASIEPQRLAQEAAILADRSDVCEEVTRLGIHCAELDKILQQGGEMGKKVDFLLQEMNRETNTILSKTNGVGGLGLEITAHGIAIKSEIEKIREQALNLE